MKLIRPIRIDGDVAYVTLSQGYIATIDATDAHLVDGFNWSVFVRPGAVYAMRTDRTGPCSRAVYMHRVIMGNPSGVEIDHKDCDGLNNRRTNLREATRAQNLQNQRLTRKNRSGFKGVSLDQASGKWRARINADNNDRSLGYFDTPEAAHAAYTKASAIMHGDFGRVA